MKANMLYFQDADNAENEYNRILDEGASETNARSLIENFYNGKDLASQCEQGDQQRDVTNRLFGYETLSNVMSEVFSHYSQGPNLFRLKAQRGTAEERQVIEVTISNEMNFVIRDSGRFSPIWRCCSGEIALHGVAHLVMRDNNDWCPRNADMRIPAGTGILAEDLTYAFEPGRLNLGQLKREYARIEKSGSSKYWSKEGLRLAIGSLEGNLQDTSANETNSREDGENRLELNDEVPEQQRTSVSVVWLYEVDHTKKNLPVTVTIVARYEPSFIKDYVETKKEIPDKILYHRKDEHPSVKNFYFPIYVDTSIGGRSTIDKIMGVGRLAYNRDVDKEEIIGEIIQGAVERARVTWMPDNDGSAASLQQFAARQTNIAPKGTKALEVPNSTGFAGLYSVIELLGQPNENLGGKGGGGRGSRELEVEVLGRQSRQSSSYQHRNNDIMNCLAHLYSEVALRIGEKKRTGERPGASESEYFYDLVAERGIDSEIVEETFKRRPSNRKPINIRVTPERIIGLGNGAIESRISQYLLETAVLRPEGARKKALNLSDSIMLRDSDLAAELAPVDQERNLDQILIAAQESAIMIRTGVTGESLPLNDEDIDSEHVPQHLTELNALIQIGDAEGWDVQQALGFESLANHTELQIERWAQFSSDGTEAKEAGDNLNNLKSQGRQYSANLQEKLQAESSEGDQLAVRAQVLKERAQLALEQNRTTAHRLSQAKLLQQQQKDENNAAIKVAELRAKQNGSNRES